MVPKWSRSLRSNRTSWGGQFSLEPIALQWVTRKPHDLQGFLEKHPWFQHVSTTMVSTPVLLGCQQTTGQVLQEFVAAIWRSDRFPVLSSVLQQPSHLSILAFARRAFARSQHNCNLETNVERNGEETPKTPRNGHHSKLKKLKYCLTQATSTNDIEKLLIFPHPQIMHKRFRKS